MLWDLNTITDFVFYVYRQNTGRGRDGWMDGSVDGSIDGSMDGWIGRCWDKQEP